MVGAWIEQTFGVVYESRSGLIALLHRLGLEHRKPQAVSRKLDPAKQQAFIDAYETLLKTLPDDEAVLFADAVHPTHGARPVGCWAPNEVKVDQTSGRDRLNIHGALDLETGRTRMIEVLTVNALSTIALLVAIEYPARRIIHVFLDNARYHHARAVQDWLAMPGRRIRLHFVPAYYLNPIERLWGLITKPSPTTDVTPLTTASAMLCLASCGMTFPASGTCYAIVYPITFASFHQRIFGFSGEPGIAKTFEEGLMTPLYRTIIHASGETYYQGEPISLADAQMMLRVCL